MIRTGRVIEVQGETLKVCFSRPEACDSCGICGSGRNDTMVTLKGTASVGDQVEVDMPEARVFKVSAVTYLLPLTGLLLGLFLGNTFFPHQELAILGIGLGMLGLALLGLKAVDRTLGSKASWQPQVIRVIPPEEQLAWEGNEKEINEN